MMAASAILMRCSSLPGPLRSRMLVGWKVARSHRLATLGGAIALAIAVLGLLALWAARQREPSYQGRNLSEWLTICRSTATSQPVREEAASAVRHIGTNGLPILLNRATDAPPQTRE